MGSAANWQILVGNGNNADALFHVTGSGSTANFGGNSVHLGGRFTTTNAQGTLRIDNGGQASGGSIEIASTLGGNGKTGRMIVEGSGSSYTGGFGTTVAD